MALELQTMKLVNNLLWILPFLCFALGYQILDQLYQTKTITTPNLVGLTIAEATKVASNLKLNIRIISEQIDQDLPQDTILSQRPAQQFIKTNQTMLVVVSTKPKPQTAPDLYGLTKQEVCTKLATPGLKFTDYELPNNALAGTCFAQSPTAYQSLSNSGLIAYFSTKSQNLVIMPNLEHLLLNDIKNLLTTNDIALKIKYLEELPNLPKNTVLAQKPVAGTIIDLNQLKQVELYLSA